MPGGGRVGRERCRLAPERRACWVILFLFGKYFWSTFCVPGFLLIYSTRFIELCCKVHTLPGTVLILRWFILKRNLDYSKVMCLLLSKTPSRFCCKDSVWWSPQQFALWCSLIEFPRRIWVAAFWWKDPKALCTVSRVSLGGQLSQGRCQTLREKEPHPVILVNCFQWGLRTKSYMVPLSLLIRKLLVCKPFNSHRNPGSLALTSWWTCNWRDLQRRCWHLL